jgi:hypothetical protein
MASGLAGKGKAMKWRKIRFAWPLVSVAAAAGCAGTSAGGSSEAPLSLLDGTWACTVEGQGEQVTLETFSYCTRLETQAEGKDADWLSCAYEISGNTGIPTICGAAVTMGTISVSADGDTLTISETGEDPPDAGTIQTFNATCARTAPPMARCGPDGGVMRSTGSGSGGEEAGSTTPPPQCTGSTCGGCSRCENGVCVFCPVGDLGICTC